MKPHWWLWIAGGLASLGAVSSIKNNAEVSSEKFNEQGITKLMSPKQQFCFDEKNSKNRHRRQTTENTSVKARKLSEFNGFAAEGNLVWLPQDGGKQEEDGEENLWCSEAKVADIVLTLCKEKSQTNSEQQAQTTKIVPRSGRAKREAKIQRRSGGGSLGDGSNSDKLDDWVKKHNICIYRGSDIKGK